MAGWEFDSWRSPWARSGSRALGDRFWLAFVMNMKAWVRAHSGGMVAFGLAVVLAGVACTGESKDAGAKAAGRESGTNGARAAEVAKPERTSWPMFRGSPGLHGVSSERLPEALALAWSYKTGGPVKSSPAIVDGRVFVGSDDQHVYAIGLRDGKKVWAFKTEGPIESSPLVLAGRVYIGSSDGFVYALDAGTGALVWKHETGDKILGAPNWVKSPKGDATWILAGSYDYKLHCLDAVTGKSNWVYESSNYINGSPAVSDGVTVFGGCDALLHVIGLTDGKQIKEVEAGAYIGGSAAMADGKVYVGHYENEFLCIDTIAGKIAWSYKDRAFAYFSSPALTKDLVIFGGRDKRLHCLKRATGEVVWTFSTQGKVDSSPVVCGDRIVVGSDDGRLYVVALADGKELWNYEIGEAVSSSPAVAEGKVVVGSQDGGVYCFGSKTK